jgi:hypothetical protein
MKLKFANALSLALIVAMLFTSAALADDVTNNLDLDVDATLEATSLTAGGANKVVDLYTVNRNDDGKNGCNLTGGTTLVVNVISSNPSVASASPAQLTFTACEGVLSNLSTAITVTPLSAGTTNVSLSLVSENADGTFNLAPASFTVNVNPPANTAPTLNLPGNLTAGATSNAGAVVNYSVSATDAQDDPDPIPSCLPASGSTFPLGTTTVNCSVTDSGGLSASGSFTVTVQDTTAPTVTVPANITAEATGPSGAAASFTASANDLVDGSITPSCSPASGSTFVLGNTTVTCSATDAAGNTGSASFTVTVRDTTAPAVTVPANMTIEATGPSGAVATFTASASDLVSGPLAATCSPATGSTFPLGTTAVNCSATDAAGNTGSASFSVSVVDTTPPTLALPSNMTVSATSAAGAVVTFSASATDIVDGAVAVICTPASGSTFAPGTTTVNCSATDAAGNTASGSFTVSVKFQLLGFYNPVDMGGVYNTVKGGSTVPLKFEVFAGSTELTSTSVIQSFVQTKIACDGTAPLDDIEITSTGGTSLRYDTTGGQFIQNWQTPRQPGSCYRVTMTTQDGSFLQAFFKLK